MKPGHAACMVALLCLASTGCTQTVSQSENVVETQSIEQSTASSTPEPITTVAAITSVIDTTPSGEITDYYEYDSDGNMFRLIDNEIVDGEYVTYAYEFSGHDDGIFTVATTDGRTITQTILEKNSAGAPTKVERTYDDRNETYTYTIEYTDGGSISRVALDVDGILVHSVNFDDTGHLSKVDNVDVETFYNGAGKPVSVSQNGYAFVTYDYDDSNRLTELDLIGWDMSYDISYEGNSEIPASYGNSQTNTQLSYIEVPATPWSAALHRTPMAVDVLNDVDPMDTGTTGFNLSTIRDVTIKSIL